MATEATGGIDMMEGWKCERCTYSNQILDVKCDICDTPRIFSEAPETHDVEIDAVLKSPVSYGSNKRLEDDPDSDDDKNAWTCLDCPFDQATSSSLVEECLLPEIKSPPKTRQGEGFEGWSCNQCTYINEESDNRCKQCFNTKKYNEAINMVLQYPLAKTDHVRTSDNTTNLPVGECLTPEIISPTKKAFDEDINGWPCNQCTYINEESDCRCKQCFFPRNYNEVVDIALQYPLEKERRIILIGRTGSGKSATGNCLLNREVFRSEVAHSSITKSCKRGTADRFGKKLLIVDTPGLFDTGMDNETVTTEILKCIGISAPGPHAILMIIGTGRFTREERETVELLRKAFGPNMHKYMIVVFTRKDDLDRKKKSIEEVVSTAPNHLRQTLSDCQNRFMAWNNNATEEEKESQCKGLLDMIEDMVDDNGGGHYESDIFSETEVVIRQREIEIRREYEADYRQQLRCMRRQLSSEYHQKAEDCREREMALNRQLGSLQQQSERENRAVQQQLENLREEMNVYTNNMSDSDMENSQRLTALKRKIAEVQDNLYEIKQQQRELRYRSEEYCEDKEREMDDYLAALDIRDDVRGEIESGSKHLLVRFMERLRGVGTKIADGFRSIYDKMKNKFSSN